jgi:hypothetical protein
MIAAPKWTGSRWRKPATLAKAFLIFLSVFSIVISLGMPGVGWIVSVLTLIIASLVAALIGKRPVAVVLGISLVHLVSFGPLAGFDVQPGVGYSFAAITVVLPFLLGFSVVLRRDRSE